MIEPLQWHQIESADGSVLGMQAPDNLEIMDKINEIIKVVSEFEKLNQTNPPKEQEDE